VHPLSFGEWAKQGDARRKLNVGFPAQAAQFGQSSKGFQIAKAYAALQTLKKRYGIQDGDADVMVVKELLAVVSSTSLGNSPAGGGISVAAGSGSMSAMSGSPSSPASNTQPKSNSWLSPWEHDISQFGGYLKDGIPGIEREIHDTVWNLEHMSKSGIATDTLRCTLLWAALYLIAGCLYKHYSLGAHGMDMIPHVGFWLEYPQLVADGFTYAKILIGLDAGGKSMGSGFSSLPSRSHRDSFAEFDGPSL
jgi:hypothetical protein